MKAWIALSNLGEEGFNLSQMTEPKKLWQQSQSGCCGLHVHNVPNMSDHPSRWTHTVHPDTDTHYICTPTSSCSPALSLQITSEMMNVVVTSPQRCSSGGWGINLEPPETHPALYIAATAHTQWPVHENPSDTSFIIWSFYVKTLKDAEGKVSFFFHLDLHGVSQSWTVPSNMQIQELYILLCVHAHPHTHIYTEIPRWYK